MSTWRVSAPAMDNTCRSFHFGIGGPRAALRKTRSPGHRAGSSPPCEFARATLAKPDDSGTRADTCRSTRHHLPLRKPQALLPEFSVGSNANPIRLSSGAMR